MMVVAWQMNESAAYPSAYTVQLGTTSAHGQTATVSGRVINNYLSADTTLPAIPTATGARVTWART
jgi:hypothetical protein